MAPLKVTAAVCVVLVLMIQLQAPAAAQGGALPFWPEELLAPPYRW